MATPVTLHQRLGADLSWRLLTASGTGNVRCLARGRDRGLQVGAEPLQLPGVCVTQEQQLLFPFFCMS